MTTLRRSTVALAALSVLSLAACSGSDDPDQPSSSSSSPSTSATATEAAEPTRLVAVPANSRVCVDDLRTGDRLAFTGPAIAVDGGAATVTRVRFDGRGLRVVDSGSVLATLGGVREPGLIAADRLDDLDPRGKPYVPDSEGDLVDATFEPGDIGLVPLVEVRVAWPATVAPGGDLSVTWPTLLISYTDAGGTEQTESFPAPVELHLAARGCQI